MAIRPILHGRTQGRRDPGSAAPERSSGRAEQANTKRSREVTPLLVSPKTGRTAPLPATPPGIGSCHSQRFLTKPDDCGHRRRHKVGKGWSLVSLTPVAPRSGTSSARGEIPPSRLGTITVSRPSMDTEYHPSSVPVARGLPRSSDRGTAPCRWPSRSGTAPPARAARPIRHSGQI